MCVCVGGVGGCVYECSMWVLWVCVGECVCGRACVGGRVGGCVGEGMGLDSLW